MQIYRSFYEKGWDHVILNHERKKYEIYVNFDFLKCGDFISIEDAVEKINSFYKEHKIDTKISVNDFMPYQTHIGNNIFVMWGCGNLYDVVVGTGYLNDVKYNLIKKIPYDLAVQKAEQILKICEVKNEQ